jgi:hypothetical protein
MSNVQSQTSVLLTLDIGLLFSVALLELAIGDFGERDG